MNSTEEGLLRAIATEPDDESHRLVYADWLEDNGEPQRAEFIRVQLQRATLWPHHPEDDPLCIRENALYEANHRRWRAGLPKEYRKDVWFRAGLPTHLSIDVQRFLEDGPALRRSLTLESISFHGNFEGRLVQILDAGLLAGIRHLEMSFARLSDEEVLALAAAPDLSEVRSLDVSSNVFGDAACRALIRSANLARLTWLKVNSCNPALITSLGEECVAMRLRHLEACSDGEVDLAALASGPACAGIEELELGSNRLGVHGLRSLATSRIIPRLRWLRLWRCGLHASSVGDLFSNDPQRLEHLSLSWNPLGPEVGRILAGVSCLGNLIELDLSRTSLGGDGLAALASSPSLGRGLRLHVSEAGISDAGLIALGRSPLFPRLRGLTLKNNPVTGRGLRGLFASVDQTDLEELDCSYLRLGDEGARAIAEAPCLRSLRRLRLEHNEIGSAGAVALAGSPHLLSLRVLGMSNNRIGDQGGETLLGSPLLDRLDHLSLMTNRMNKPVKAQFRERRTKTKSISL